MSESQHVKAPLVLVVDDDHTTRMMALEFVSQAGFRFAEAGDGEEALKCLATEEPDLILLDVEMPGLSGFEVCSKLRAMPKYANTPVLMLTGLNNNKAIDLAYSAGATDFATKPINWSLLCRRLKYMYRASKASEELTRSQERLTVAQRIAELGSWSFNFSTREMLWSDQMYLMFGIDAKAHKPSLKLLCSVVHPDDKSRVVAWFKNVTNKKFAGTIDFQIVSQNGQNRQIRQVLEQVFSDDGKLCHLQATVQDFTDRRKAEQRIHQLAFYDELTGLANRTLFSETLSQSINMARENGEQFAVAYFDLDDFKKINDTFGHSIGDKMIHAVGERVKNMLCVYESKGDIGYRSSTLARMSGDEFTLLLEGIESKSSVASLANVLTQLFEEPLQVDGHELFTSLSIGTALFPEDGETVDVLLRNADIAMYDAKRAGKNMHRFFSHDRDAELVRYHAVEDRMRMALKEDQFEVFYQPQLDLESGKVDSAEALLRWSDAELGFVSPIEFIPIAEENGFILELGEWVLRTACEQTKRWIDDGFDVQKMAVNISVLQFAQAGFTELIESVLADTGLDAAQLKLEITESVLAVDTEHAVNALKALKQVGVELSIDDFGTGYSSLSQLKHFPIDQLKIDQSFIRHLTENSEDKAITKAIIAMAGSMNIKVLAEGVETAEHLEFLRANECDEIQGYYICKPMNAQDLANEMGNINNLLAEIFSDGALSKAS